ncbi:AraC-like ligand-binding domain-containing protein [Streptomyces noursei]
MLKETVFRSEDVPVGDRLAYWAECVGRTHAPVRMSSEHAHDFRATQRVLDLGPVTVWPATFQQLRTQRTPKLIRRSDPEVYHVSLITEGTAVIDWAGHGTTYHPSDLHINDSSVPWELRTDDAPVTAVGIELPRALLPLPPTMTERALPRRMSSQDGIGGLLTQFLRQVTADASSFQPTDGGRLGEVLIDLVAALFAHAVDSDEALPAEPRRRALTLSVQQFALAHLHDPELTPSALAAAHHISVAYLHRLFQHEERTVAAWIRLRRLEAACRDLADPSLHSTPIHTIARRWGFRRASDFSRAFRAAYGTSPKDYRGQARPEARLADN